MSDSNISGVFLLRDVRQRILDDFWPKTAPTVETLIGNVSTVNEGGIITVSVNTADYSEGDTLYWTIEGVSGTVNASDFSALSGSFTIQANNFGHFSVTTTEDGTTEGFESFQIQIRKDSTSGTVLVIGEVLGINDTSTNQYGWFAGGRFSSIFSRIDRISFNSDTGTASIRGNLSTGRSRGAGVGNLSYGWHSADDETTKIARITYSNDTATATLRGNLSAAREYVGGTTTNSYGWFAGGILPSPVSSRIDRLDFLSDTTTNSVRGPLSSVTWHLSGTGNNSYGWFGGGRDNSNVLSKVDRVNYSSDTSTASVRGPLASYSEGIASTGNDSYGWFGGSTQITSTLTRITYSNDTVTSTNRGPLSLARTDLTATGNDSYGWFGGGVDYIPVVSAKSRIDRITFASDTGTASIRGPLSLSRFQLSSSSGQA